MDDAIPSVSVPAFGTPRYNEFLKELHKDLMPAGTLPAGLYSANRDRKRYILETIPRLSEFTLPGDRSWARMWYLHSFKRDSVVARDFHENVYSVYMKHMSRYAGRKKSDWKDALRERPTKAPASANRPVTQAIDDWLTRRQFRGRVVLRNRFAARMDAAGGVDHVVDETHTGGGRPRCGGFHRSRPLPTRRFRTWSSRSRSPGGSRSPKRRRRS